jgi:hypothetical protein
MSTRNFYHGKDAEIVAGSANFHSLISAAPTTYGLVAAQATSFGALNTTLQSAYTAAVTPETRTPVAIEAKNLAIINMRRSAINLSKIVYSTLTVNDWVAMASLPSITGTMKVWVSDCPAEIDCSAALSPI